MIETDVDYLDDKITVTEQEPATLDDLVQTYGAEFVRQYFVSNLRYRNKHPRVYAKASTELTEIEPKAVKKEEAGRKIYESDIDHCRRCYVIDPDTTTETITRIAQTEPLYVKGERVGAGRISQGALDAANQMFESGDDIVEQNVAVIESTMPGFRVGRDGEGKVTPETLARGIGALNRFLIKQNPAMQMLKT
jgi:hypothetical protein